MEFESKVPTTFESSDFVYIPYAGETPTVLDIPAVILPPVDDIRTNLPA